MPDRRRGLLVFGPARRSQEWGHEHGHHDRRRARRRRTTPPFRYGAALANRDRAGAGRTAGRPRAPSTRRTRAGRGPTRTRRRRASKVYLLDMFPYPSGTGPARRAPAGLHRHRRAGPLPADDRPQRAARDGLRRVRAARRAVRRADRHPPAQHHRGEHPRATGRSCAGWAWRTTTAARWPPPTSSSTAGPSGSSCRSSTPGTTRRSAGPARSPSWRPSSPPAPGPTPDGRAWSELTDARAARGWSTPTGWPTSPRRRSTGARAWARCWPTRRSPPTGAASAATSRCSAAT